MLTAQKDSSPLETESMRQRLSTTRSFDRVVNSIEGLRGRVQGFTLEQVSEIEQKLRTLSAQLDELQRTVDALAEMKQEMGDVQKAVQQAEAESLEQSKRITTVEPMSVQSIARMGALLKFRRVLKVLKETNNKISVAADPEVKIPFRPIPVEIPTEQSNNKQEFATDLRAILDRFDPRPESADNVVVTHEALEQTETLSHPTTVEKDFEPVELFPEALADIVPDVSTLALEPQERTAEFDDTRQEPPANHEAIFEEFKGTRDIEVDLAVPETDREERTEQTDKFASEEMDFDQRLLDDLIKNYGEFTILPTSTSEDALTDDATREHGTETLQARPRANTPTPAIPSLNLPSPRKDGELDQKLKKLIKDYGEYDLYSRQTPAKLKTGVIAAFLLLTLILAGLYFFYSPKATVSPNIPSPSLESALDKTSKEIPASDKTHRGETLSAPTVSNVDAPKAIESGPLQNGPNKNVTKKTK